MQQQRCPIFKLYVPCCQADSHGTPCQCAESLQTFPGLYRINLRDEDTIRADNKEWVNWVQHSFDKVDDDVLCIKKAACSCSLHKINLAVGGTSDPPSCQSVVPCSVSVEQQRRQRTPSPPQSPNLTLTGTPEPRSDVGRDSSMAVQSSNPTPSTPPTPSSNPTASTRSQNATNCVKVFENDYLSAAVAKLSQRQEDIIHCQDRQGQLIANMMPMIHQQELWNRLHALSSAVDVIQQQLVAWGADFLYADRRWY